MCLSDCEEELTNVTDRLITCSLCLGTIHQQHYGSEIHSNVPQKWFCHRCRTFLASSTGPDSPVPDIRCDYCPLRSGIMKQVDYDKKKLWVLLVRGRCTPSASSGTIPFEASLPIHSRRSIRPRVHNLPATSSGIGNSPIEVARCARLLLASSSKYSGVHLVPLLQV